MIIWNFCLCPMVFRLVIIAKRVNSSKSMTWKPSLKTAVNKLNQRASLTLERCLWEVLGVLKSYTCKIAPLCFEHILSLNLPLEINFLLQVSIQNTMETHRALLFLQRSWTIALPFCWGTPPPSAGLPHPAAGHAVTLTFILADCQSRNDLPSSWERCS